MTWQDKLKNNHGLIMVLCCAIPVVVVVVGTYYFGWQQRSYLVWLFLLLCPLMHYWMMKEMHGKEKNSEDKSSAEKQSSEKEKRPSCH